MVQLSQIRYTLTHTFGRTVRGKKFNHRVPLKYQRFQKNIDPDNILVHYSRDNLKDFDRRAGERTYRDAQKTLGRESRLIQGLSHEDLKYNQIFQEEQERQRAIIARVDKIHVQVDSVPGRGTDLLVDKEISTPYDCAKHVHELLTDRSVVAEILPLRDETNPNDKYSEETKVVSDQDLSLPKQDRLFWDMHRPLMEECRLRFRHFKEDDVHEVNKAYWRSCSFVLGMAIRLAFKDQIKVLLHSWPSSNFKSGSFVYDAAVGLSKKWEPSDSELRAFTKVMWSIKGAELPFERLDVSIGTARRLFERDLFKLEQLESIASKTGKVPVYRCGGLLDISVGPMISNTSQIGRISLASVHPFTSVEKEFDGVFYRFQGVSVPSELYLSSFLYQNLLISQARKLNTTQM